MTASSTPTDSKIRLGLRENVAQFTLLVGVNALVGGMIGQERTVLPLLAEDEFGLTKFTAALTFIAAFGVVKAATNFFAGTLSDRYGRKPVLVAGWLIGIPVPLLLIWAPSWGWVIAANVLLGVNQGLTWSTTVIMKIDLVGPERRGFAMGLNEAAGYGAVALTALATGFIAATSSFAPWVLGALALGIGTAMVYPTLLAAIGDVAHPRWRASAVGIYRLWRDAGFAVGAILVGIIAEAFGIATAIWSVAALTALSGLIVAVRMYETHRVDPTPR